MRRHPYSAGAVKVAFWFQEFRTLVELLAEGRTYEEIRELNEQENIFGASTVTRKKQIYNTVVARARCMDESFVPLFMRSSANAQKQLVLAAVMAHDTLFHEFVYEVIHEKLVLCSYELMDADMEKFFRRKQVQDERVIDHSDNAREIGKATKRREKLQKQLKECQAYDEQIAAPALARINIDLDDGVKVNYNKVQTVEGKKYNMLTDIKL